MEDWLVCECGDIESQHVDNVGMCMVPECGCKRFEEEEREENIDRI